ncbi:MULTISPECIES: ABC transporter ATP-binding protein [unclassified Rhizobium]|uniref:ABC transporter ATP-binding protein n=1 Tax=unclassified Rhizobium TaxID=2613769 RepID=UPI00115C57F2|nr:MULTISPECIES: ABC transporter ATP-binding protein [unclassified Rhizobium]MBZ5759413.1 ABC transporter ATP-binding protein [Rhizobium sp. VS19-DR96]MBZ5765854.1 ABC transporter ATP-binding protein [Rhizobium sp. VS19-DR129.2]MBZ5773938.1 ABC transporter ATP-binding protein [Rhizobium sp. VS19-DRK62.2]MBZ5785010.1 ABC transporter ATP-binding protein [Rhizobium sp. VS19-DR121]MBZ5801913.1 ABC transporter ATP-binding protein [Rhizobium sp. VS19-DR181]
MTETASSPAALSVRNLCVDARTPEGRRRVLDDIDFDLMTGETLCLAGESGSGKSVTSLAVMGLLPKASLQVASGKIMLAGRDLLSLPERAMRKVRGGEIAMVFQEPMTSLNPVISVGDQLTEAIREHQDSDTASAVASALRMLDAVQITDPARRLKQFPHELSGGMRQRVMIAMALSCRPKVLIADEPTTALDVTVQAQILSLMRELKSEFGTSIILITHDMGVVAEMADRVVIMQNGRMVEKGAAIDIFERPTHAYTQELLGAVPRLGAHAGTDGPPRVTARGLVAPTPLDRTPVLNVSNLTVTYGSQSGWLLKTAKPAAAVDGVSFDILPGKTLGLVGESGSGKSTTGKAVLGLIPYQGDVVIDGRNIGGLSQRDMQPVRRSAQMIFQDPYASLDPRMAVGAAVAEPMIIHGIGSKSERRDRVAELLRRVGLTPDAATRYPHEFSGGQRQRICIARALALEPKLIVADESVAALDVSVRARVLDLLLELQETMGLAYLFISHDMAVIERMSHHVVVMRYGKIVESGTRRQVFETPKDAYTQALLAAVPAPDPRARGRRLAVQQS